MELSDLRSIDAWLAPRGLITVLLYVAAKAAIERPRYPDGTVMLVVLISATLIAVGRYRMTEPTPPISRPDPA